MINCPYCHATMNASQIVTLCTHVGCDMAGQSIPPRVGQAIRRRLPRIMRVRGGRVFALRALPCESCGYEGRPICTACGQTLPPQWGRYPTCTLALLGQSGAGKSTLLASIWQALDSLPTLQVNALDIENTAERFYANYTKPLYEDLANVPATVGDVPAPLLYGVVSRPSAFVPAQTLLTAMYDFPGEMLEEHTGVERAQTVLSHADALALIINPLHLPVVRRRLEARGTDCGEYRERSLAMMERLLDELYIGQELGSPRRVTVAVVLTHLDVWLPLYAPYPTHDTARQDDFLRACIADWQGGRLLGKLGNFARTRVFATGIKRAENAVTPLLGVQEPLVYLLSGLGMYIKRKNT